MKLNRETDRTMLLSLRSALSDCKRNINIPICWNFNFVFNEDTWNIAKVKLLTTSHQIRETAFHLCKHQKYIIMATNHSNVFGVTHRVTPNKNNNDSCLSVTNVYYLKIICCSLTYVERLTQHKA